MANTIQIKRSSTASDTPSASDLSVGELAVNTADAKLFTKHTDGTVKELAGGGGSGISAVVDDTSPQLGGNLDTNNKNILLGDSDSGNSFANRIKLGAGNDLQIFHSGTASFISDTGTGNLYITGSNAIAFNSGDYGETYATFNDDGAVTLRHDDSIKFSTSSTGATVTGTAKATTAFQVDGASSGSGLFGASGSSGGAKINADSGSDAATFIDFDATNISASGGDVTYRFGRGTTEGSSDLSQLIFYGHDGTNSPVVTMDSTGAITANQLNLGDNERLRIGASPTSDLQIWHDGTNSNIVNGTGSLIIADTSGDVKIQGKYGEQSIVANNDGSVELYHDNSKKLETTSTGAEITGDLTLTSTADNGAVLKLVSNDPDDVVDFGIEGQIQFFAENDASESLQYYGMQLRTADVTDGTEDGWLYFNSIANGTLTNANALGSDGTFYMLGNGNASNAVIKWFQTRGTSNNVSLAVATPSADRTITLPDSTGTVLTTGNSDTPTTTTSSGDADFVLVDDGGTMKKITPSNLGIGGGGGGITVQEEGSTLSTTATTLNFTGNGVTASGTGATKTIAVNGNEVLISSGTVSNVASIDFDSSVITGFEQYRVVLYNVTPASDARELRMRLGTSNTAITSSIYQGSLYQYGISGTGSSRSATAINANSAFFYLTAPTNDMGTNTGENCYAEVLLPNPNSTSGYKHVVARVSNYSYYPAIMGQRISAMAMREQSAINFVTFFAESGNIATASFRLYGIS